MGEREHKPGASKAAQSNFGLDDENGNYKLFPNDQIAFRYQVLKMLGSGSFGQVRSAAWGWGGAMGGR